MYILLNIKDGEKASAAITLLIKNGYTSMTTGEEMTEICPDCSGRATATENSISSAQQPEAGDASLDWLNDTNPTIRIERLNDVNLDWLMSQTSSPVPRQKKTPTFWKSNEDIGTPLLMVKEEPMNEAATEALQETSGPKEVLPTPLKRAVKKRRDQDDDQGLTCAYCKGFITWGGSTPVANIERHLKLHASKSQFSCSMCEYTCGRRYMAKSHIDNHHPPHIEGNDAIIIDHTSELAEEYAQLWLHCFPGLDIAQYRAKKKELGEKKRKFEYNLVPKRAENEEVRPEENEEQKKVLDILMDLTQ